MMQASAILVMILGVVMLNRGFSLSGFDPFGAIQSNVGNVVSGNVAEVRGDVQYVNATFTGRSYEPITVQAGIPVVWTIDVEAINGCNNPITISAFDMMVDLSVGENIVEFTPTEAGTIPFSCWMGMIRSRIVVVDDLRNISADEAALGDRDGLDSDIFEFIVSGIATATIIGEVQEVTLTIENGLFVPNAIALQEGLDFIINFNLLDPLNTNNPQANFIYFYEYGGGINLTDVRESPPLPSIADFSFGNMFGEMVFVALVSDIEDFDYDDVIQRAAEYFEDF